MTVYYQQIRALIDPEQSDPLPDGGRLQDVSVILIDRPEHGVGTGAGALPTGRAHPVSIITILISDRAACRWGTERQL